MQQLQLSKKLQRLKRKALDAKSPSEQEMAARALLTQCVVEFDGLTPTEAKKEVEEALS
jgi:hypothetical protein